MSREEYWKYQEDLNRATRKAVDACSTWEPVDFSKDAYQKKFDEQIAGVGDINSDAKGTGARFNTGKADLSLVPLDTLEGEARVWMHGEKKYKRFNWKKGMAWSVPLACALRHLAAWQRGEDLDPESGQPHLAHIICNIRMLTYYADHFPEGDDRFKGDTNV